MTLGFGRDAYELAAEDALDRQERHSRPRGVEVDCESDDDDTPEHCETCHGQGEVFAPDRTGDRTIACPDCDGRETV